MKTITQAQYDTHDCHLSQDDGCEVCDTYFWQHYAKHSEDFVGYEKFLIDKVNRNV